MDVSISIHISRTLDLYKFKYLKLYILSYTVIYFSTDYYTASNTMSLTRASTSAVSGGAQHVAGPLAGTQGAPVVPQGTLQQPTQQAQPLPSMGIPMSQAGTLLSQIYLTHILICYYSYSLSLKIQKDKAKEYKNQVSHIYVFKLINFL